MLGFASVAALGLSLIALGGAPLPSIAGASACEKDVAFLLDELEKGAKPLLALKNVDWKAVRAEFTAAAKKVKGEDEHVKLCARLVARLKDGHATLLDITAKLPDEPPRHGIGLCLCEAGGKVFVKQSFGGAAGSGISAGDEVLSIEDKKPADWIESKTRELCDQHGFSTAHAARYAACHWGFSAPDGTRFPIEVERASGKGKKKVTLTCGKDGGEARYIGPPFPPKDLTPLGKRDAWGKIESGYGYVVLREVAGDLAQELDTALSGLGDVPGLILDMRANGGGGTDHEEVFGRFLAAGQTWRQYTGKDGSHYTGPMVVIVDAGTRSTGETISGMLKEDGRAYMIGATPTAGMSSQKVEIEVPSKLFKVRFSVGSNKARFNGGQGIEGLGVPPDEVVAWNAKQLAAGVDPFVRRAEELLKKGFPKGAVAYAPPKKAH